MRPIDIIKKALSLEEGKKLTISFPPEDRKKFMSLKASLYESKKSFQEGIKITTKTNQDRTTSISVEKETEDSDNNFNLTIEDSDCFQLHQDIQEIENTQKKKVKPGQLEVNKLTQEKEEFLLEFSTFMKENQEEILIPDSSARSKASEMQSKLSSLEKILRDTKSFYKIEPTRTPATLEELIKQEKDYLEITQEEEEELKRMEERRVKKVCW